MKSLPILSIDIGEDAGDDCTTAITDPLDSDKEKSLIFWLGTVRRNHPNG